MAPGVLLCKKIFSKRNKGFFLELLVNETFQPGNTYCNTIKAGEMMENFNWTKEAEKQWNERSGFWNSRSKEMWDHGSRKDIVPFVKKHIKIGSKMCDLGCGDGYGSVTLARQGFHVTGIDVSAEMIDKAIKQAEGLPVMFTKGDISNVPFADDTFDAALVINSLEWTESPLKVLNEMKRIVKNGGYACVAILGPTAMPRKNSFDRLYGKQVICNTMMPWEFEKLAGENGWVKIDEYGVYKRGADKLNLEGLSLQLKQALTFMWVFMLINNK
jgi:SAM-dependent methyltransferase